MKSKRIELGKYIVAYEMPPKKGNKLPYYALCNKDFEVIDLGTIQWYGRWRKYCWFTDSLASDIVFDDKCLLEIMSFLNVLNNEWRLKQSCIKEKY